MQIYYWKSGDGNFGDDLNLWLWDALMPGKWPDNKAVMLAGVGTVLSSRHLTHQGPLMVLGSGTGYGELASVVTGENCHIYGVRGPLTAGILGLDEDKVLADPAILIADIQPQSMRTERTAPKVVFVPHLESARRCDWQAVCAQADIECVDPRGESKSVIARIANASLVLAESMHAAIIADAYRVPWIPVWSTREINKFKWTDWALSVGAVVKPQFISPPSRLASLDNRTCSLVQNDNAEMGGTDFDTHIDPDQILANYRAILLKRQSRSGKLARKIYNRLRRVLFEPFIMRIGNQSRATQRATVKQLSLLATQTGYLSDDEQFEQAKRRLYASIDTLKQDRMDNFANTPVSPRRAA